MRKPTTRTPPTSCHRTIYARNTLWDAIDQRAAAAGFSRSEFAERVLSHYLQTTLPEADRALEPS